MKILKDAPLSIMTKIFGYGGRYFLSATALLGFPLTSPEILLPEDELWSRAADSLSRGEVIDLGMPKPQGEVLVSGRCFSHDGTPMEATTAALYAGPFQVADGTLVRCLALAAGKLPSQESRATIKMI